MAQMTISPPSIIGATAKRFFWGLLIDFCKRVIGCHFKWIRATEAALTDITLELGYFASLASNSTARSNAPI